MAFNELRKRGTAVRVLCDGPSPGAYAAAARGKDGSFAAMLVNCGEETLPFTLEDNGGALRNLSCRITDDSRTWEETALPADLPPHSILLVVNSAAMADVVISNGLLSATISPRGAELRSVRMGDFEYMWQKEADHPSGIATVLFPICGSLFQGRYTFEGREYRMPGHGFVKNAPFRAERSPDGTCAVFTLESDDTTKAMYPFDFSLAIAFRLNGSTLSVEATVRNTGTETMPFAYGGHPGFNVPLGGDGAFEDWFLEFAPGANPDAFEFGEHGLINGRKHALPLSAGNLPALQHRVPSLTYVYRCQGYTAETMNALWINPPVASLTNLSDGEDEARVAVGDVSVACENRLPAV